MGWAITFFAAKNRKIQVNFASFEFNKLYHKCENSSHLTLVTKAKALRRMAEKKQQEMQELNEEIAECLLARKQ